MTARRIAPYVCIVLVVGIALATLASVPADRVGDGSEYFGMFHAWNVSHRPWMTPAAFDAYERFLSTQQVRGLVPTQVLKDAFPALRLPTGADFNHFWLYSALAYAVSKVAALAGLSLSPPASFLALHGVLLVLTAGLAYRLHGLRGLIAAGLLLLGSPLFWYVNKVHTELFTFSLTLGALMLVHAHRYLGAALLLALASTQNPSFALVALVPLGMRSWLDRSRPYSPAEVLAIAATVAALAAHPVYYFLRFGVPTPQVLAGGASLGSNLGNAYIWWLDPDVGLLPNWPLGVGVLALATVLWALQRRRNQSAAPPDWPYLVFAAAFTGVNLLAHASTTNLNSGGTPGIARYALWYLPLAFPFLLYVIDRLPKQVIVRSAFAGMALALVGLSMTWNDPRLTESYETPTALSKFIQTRASWLYSPPHEIFAERYSGVGEAVWQHNPAAIVGPDCRKILALPHHEQGAVFAPASCFLDRARLPGVIDGGQPTKAASYLVLTADQASAATLKLAPGTYKVGPNGNGNFALGVGWSEVEAWGAWSAAPTANLDFPCPSAHVDRDALTIRLKLQPFREQDVSITQRGNILWKGHLAAGADVLVKPALEGCVNGFELQVNVSSPKSPRQLGLSQDDRLLGVSLVQFDVF